MLKQNIELKNGIWRGSIELEVWKKFFLSDKKIDLNIGGDMRVENIEEIHEKAYDYLIENQEAILKTILENVSEQYPMLQEEYGYDDSEKDEYMPDICNIDELKEIFIPQRIHIMNVANENIAYLGFSFWCSWDEEHGFGIMTHKNRIVKTGGEDVAFLSWVAEEDKESEERQ